MHFSIAYNMYVCPMFICCPVGHHIAMYVLSCRSPYSHVCLVCHHIVMYILCLHIVL